jgi:signal transduction histidine kinase
MQGQENALLEARKYSYSMFFDIMLWILGAMLACSLLLFWIHYRLLTDELGKREEAESGARRLSAHILELQDEERRKFSRELHDSLGQNLAVAKMVAFGVSERNPTEEGISELIDLLEKSLQETRTISHLLHPPLLDELGIASAVSWYVDGFSQRSGLKISLKISDQIGRLSRPAELALFRVLQESLTNVHRHAKSAKADVELSVAEGDVVLQVRDYGKGIAPDKLQHFRSNGTQVGVGLTGMRERVRELGGQFEIYSGGTGTEVFVTIPLRTAQRPNEEITTVQDAD